MRIVAYRRDGVRRFGVVDAEVVYDAGESIEALSRGARVGMLAEITLEAPLPETAKVVGIGLNYRAHAMEAGQPVPETPILFAKFGSSIIGPGQTICIPPIATNVDYEAELGVVIARPTKGVAVAEALESVLGYTCVNDVSARDLQFADGQWVRGKSLDTFCPVGPWITTVDEITDPQALTVRCAVNGEERQSGPTSDMVFSVAELIAFVSAGITLLPGDLIATGTPYGVGVSRKPPAFLRSGDIVQVEIEGIGTLENPVGIAEAR